MNRIGKKKMYKKEKTEWGWKITIEFWGIRITIFCDKMIIKG